MTIISLGRCIGSPAPCRRRILKQYIRTLRQSIRIGDKVKGFSSTARIDKTFDKFKVLFCGSDEFSVASLKAVYEARDLWESIDVVVPPEKEIGRGGKQHKSLDKYIPALKQYADHHALPTHSVPSEGIKSWTPPAPFDSINDSHILLTASFGHIIPSRLLKLFPENHKLNVHPSLLPKYRGAAPIQWTIANGDIKTGVSVQKLVKYSKGVDAGEILGSIGNIPVPKDATYNSFLPQLSNVGGDLLVDVLRQLRDGTAKSTPQDEGQITYAPKITHEIARIRWDEQSAEDIDRLHRGIQHQVTLWTPVLSTTAHFISLKPLNPSEYPSNLSNEVGIAYLEKYGKNRRLFVSCAQGSWLEVLEIQMAGKKVLEIKEWWNGLPKDVRDSGKIKLS
ncbi:methionyl-tRNA formyltransferase [Kwoniella pini CBS 10737]|uniref:methionyl-tRNA formyltransferase n=1 Tax=Kwoniella pini CBS 10737 TaxID=1296096 RepID=A0A1B9I3X0_9TREE|nr:methionyl-tRNA formyltransferase [Kwoniella pini CBS 10737]OCF50216.1 methionyl-tRNA formyltransferase [Kwoniella pini CBS 10737]